MRGAADAAAPGRSAVAAGAGVASPWAAASPAASTLGLGSTPRGSGARGIAPLAAGTPRTPFGVRGRGTAPLDAGEDGAGPSEMLSAARSSVDPYGVRVHARPPALLLSDPPTPHVALRWH